MLKRLILQEANWPEVKSLNILIGVVNEIEEHVLCNCPILSGLLKYLQLYDLKLSRVK
jgi:hypothetical protein